MSTSPGRQRRGIRLIMAKIVRDQAFNSNAPKKPACSFVAVCNYTPVGLVFRKSGADDQKTAVGTFRSLEEPR